jgi:Rrf2 family protein
MAVLKLSKKADYGLIALRHLALADASGNSSAAEIAHQYHISPQLMAKVLQRLARRGLVKARHGSNGGYTLARDPGKITALEVIHAIDGPQSITGCTTHSGECQAASRCTVREPLRQVNESIMQVLSAVTISHMARSSGAELVELSM